MTLTPRLVTLTPRLGMRSRTLVALMAGVAMSVEAQGRAPVRESIQVIAPAAVRAVRMDGATVLVWELLVRNASADSVTITRLVVRDGSDSMRVLLDASDTSLARDLQSPTRGVTLPTPERLAPGDMRTFYGWVTLDGGPVRSIRQQFDVRLAGAPDPVRIRVEAVPVRPSSPVVLAPPLRGGPWAAIHLPEIAGGHRRAIYTLDGASRIPGRFAIDWVRLTSDGRLAPPAAPDRNGFGDEVLAVGDGRIVIARDDMPDNVDSAGRPRRRFDHAHASGNVVALELTTGAVVFYEHLQAGSVRVREGERVRAGAVLAQLGYSGSSSIGPHLHMHVADRASILAAEGEPFVLRRYVELGRFGTLATMLGGEQYSAGGGRTRTGEFPAMLSVLQFPSR